MESQPSDEPGHAATASVRATELLIRVRNGEPGAADELIPLLYDELRSIAGRVMGEVPNGTLSPTVLVHEAYLRLVQANRAERRDREHFCALAAKAMRHTLIDHARAKRTEKRGGQVHRGVLDENQPAPEVNPVDLLELDEALTRLEREHPRVARIFELRFFGGLGVAEVARILHLSESMIEKDSRLGRAFLRRELG